MDLDHDPLGLTREQIRELGYQVVDLLADQLTDPEIPAMRRGDPVRLRAQLERPPSEDARDWPGVLETLAHEVLAPMNRLAHPGQPV
jgi:hypothetical protein